jgi:hypothetical protein
VLQATLGKLSEVQGEVAALAAALEEERARGRRAEAELEAARGQMAQQVCRIYLYVRHVGA